MATTECVYKGVTYSSGTEWSSPDDPCTHFKCLAGVITESNLQCYTPCGSSQLPGPGQCCPTCAGELFGLKLLDDICLEA